MLGGCDHDNRYNFLAGGISKFQEYDVKEGPRTGAVAHDPPRTLAVEVTEAQPTDAPLSIPYGKKYYSVPDTVWNRESFKVLYGLFQMRVVDVSKVGVPITISK